MSVTEILNRQLNIINLSVNEFSANKIGLGRLINVLEGTCLVISDFETILSDRIMEISSQLESIYACALAEKESGRNYDDYLQSNADEIKKSIEQLEALLQ
ncbi:hypothetical protein [Curvivirga sp.]|uniref:hypothetical protein n=1 Tax=Curvivirga sp. TaxID=2856848 RepID=UPI003B598767